MIDLSELPAPEVVEIIPAETIMAEIKADLIQRRPEIGPVLQNESAVVVKLLEAVAYRETRLRARVNDAARSILLAFAAGGNLDAIAARQGVERLVIEPATQETPAVMETDAQLRRRYLLSFDRPAAGARDRYLLEAYTAVPDLRDARVNGFDVHGRRGDTDVVIVGADGAAATDAERDAVSAAVRAPDVKPEAVSVSVLRATRAEYTASVVAEIGTGPDPELVRQDIQDRVTTACRNRMIIGGEIPAGFIPGAAYGPNVIKVRDLAPVAIEPDPYTVPILTDLTVTVEVRG